MLHKQLFGSVLSTEQTNCDNQNGANQMPTYVLECCNPPAVLSAKDNLLVYHINLKNTSDVVRPISTLQKIQLVPPSGLSKGKLILTFGGSPSGYIGVGGAAIGVGSGPLTYLYKKDQSESAEQLYQYVLSAISSTAQNAEQPSNFVDELVKLKALLDQGALTQEEFDISKKKLLGV